MIPEKIEAGELKLLGRVDLIDEIVRRYNAFPALLAACAAALDLETHSDEYNDPANSRIYDKINAALDVAEKAVRQDAI